MDLLEENPVREKKTLKVKLWLIVVIVLIILLIIAAVCIWLYSQKIMKDAFKVKIDGVYSQKASQQDNLFIIQNNKVYTSISGICSYIGYMYYPGGYKQYSEDRTKCYVTNQKEIVTFSSGLNEIVKYPTIDANSEPQSFEIEEAAITRGDNLFIGEDGLKKAFNVLISYNIEENSLEIATLPNIVNYYESSIKGICLEKSNFEDFIKFNNEKALLKNLAIVRDEKTKLYGVSSINNGALSPIITARYTKIQYMEGSGDFIVTTEDNKVGIIGSDGITKVKPDFDRIQEIDKNIGLYLVTNGGNQGVINRNGKIIVPQDYDRIGLEPNSYDDKNVTNRYILYGSCIPVQLNNKWGFIDIDGNKVIPVEYDKVGCQEVGATGIKNTNGIVIIPEIKGIVLEKDFKEGKNTIRKYGIINVKGEPITDFILDSAYMTTVNNESNYYVTLQDQVIDIVEYWRNQRRQTSGSSEENNVNQNETVSEGNTVQDNNVNDNEIEQQINSEDAQNNNDDEQE